MIWKNKKILITVLVIVCVIAAIAVFFAVRKQKIRLERNEKLLLIMIDGVRYDYVSRDPQLRGFQTLASKGVKAEYMEPVYPSNTYPNWYAIPTGLYPENHGIMNNYMYDDQLNDFFFMAPNENAAHPHWWNKAEPIWVTAEKAGKKVSMYNWDGCNVKIHDTVPTGCFSYKSLSGWDTVNEDTENALDDILNGFKSNNFSLSLLYYEPVDRAGHVYGPDSEEAKQALRDIDNILIQLLGNIEERGLSESVNVYIVSDHGMARPTKLVDLGNYLNYSDVKMTLGAGSFSMIRAVDKSAENRIYEAIKNISNLGITVYKKDEIPEEMGIKHNRLTLPLIVVAHPGNVFTHPEVEKKVYPNSKAIKPPMGAHGYFAGEYDQMRGITYAVGPAFKSGYIHGPVKQVDHYQVFCKILGLTPKKHDGSWSRVRDMLL